MIRLLLGRYHINGEKMFFNSIKRANLLLSLIFVVACTSLGKKDGFDQEFQGVAPEMRPYVKDFVELVGPHYRKDALKNLSIGIRALNEGEVVGLCKLFTTNGGAEILIDRSFWDVNGSEKREALMLHELGHCLCFLRHEHFEGSYKDDGDEDSTESGKLKKGYFDDNCPVTLMHPNVLSANCYRTHRNHYRWELRTRCNAQQLYIKHKNGQ